MCIYMRVHIYIYRDYAIYLYHRLLSNRQRFDGGPVFRNMYIYIFYICICLYIYVYICIYIYMYICVYIHISTYICIYALRYPSLPSTPRQLSAFSWRPSDE